MTSVSGPRSGRVDFHLHSYASNVTEYYASNSLSIPESYSDPRDLHRLLKSRGMELVTLTDHNSISGALELIEAGYEDVFLSAEMTTTFPEDGCNIHVTIANVSEEQFRECDRLRPNVYEMVRYLDDQIAAETPDGRRIAYFMTHPLMSTQNRPYGREGALSVAHIEKALLLFNCIEIRNGARSRSFNELTARLVSSLTPARIAELAERHGLEPKGETPWLKAVVGGSDDHCGINPGRTWTEFEYEGERATPNDVIDSIRGFKTRACGSHGGPITLAHALVKLLYDGQFSKHRSKEKAPISMGSALNMLLGFAFEGEKLSLRRRVSEGLRVWFQEQVGARLHRAMKIPPSFEDTLVAEARTLLRDSSFRERMREAGHTDDKIFTIIGTLLNRIFARYVQRLQGRDSKNLIATVKELIAMVSSNLLVSLPYFLSYSHHSSDKLRLRDIRKAFDFKEQEKLILVTDTFFEINGVARTISRMIDEALRRDRDLCVVTCLSDAEEQEAMKDARIRDLVARRRLKIFRAVAQMDLPEYEGLQVRLLPFLELLEFAQEGGFTKMQISTPGPVGVMGLLAAKILQLETSSTYHTSFPEYVETYTGDVSLEALTWKYMILFYHAVDEVVVPSKYIARLLHQRGLRNRKILILDRWVDLERYHPSKRTPGFWSRYGLQDEDQLVKFVHVGRVSSEKNLDTLVQAFRRLCEDDENAHLLIVGDGPYRARLERSLEGLPVTFTGFLEGEELARAVASADAKLFPSTTDTWGNAPLEAQASGLPVVVSDVGGPQELMRHGVTGYRVRGGDPKSLYEAMKALMDDAERRTMGEAARRFVEEHEVREPYTAILDSQSYRRRRAAEAKKKAEKKARKGRPSAGQQDDLEAARLV